MVTHSPCTRPQLKLALPSRRISSLLRLTKPTSFHLASISSLCLLFRLPPVDPGEIIQYDNGAWVPTRGSDCKNWFILPC
jgi:hypothetical protein